MNNHEIVSTQLRKLAECGNRRLREVHVGVNRSVIEEFKDVLGSSKFEDRLQEFLGRHPEMVPRSPVGGLTCGWVIPKQKFGDLYETDFLSVRLDTPGLNWMMIELQRPTDSLYTKAGRTTEQLDEGYRQIRQWDEWLQSNASYAQRSRDEGGLGLPNLTSAATGLVVIGRGINNESWRWKTTPGWQNGAIHHHSYDRLIRNAYAVRENTPDQGEVCEACGIVVGEFRLAGGGDREQS